MSKKLTKEEFIERAKEVHRDKYDYSKVEYVNNHTKVTIVCPEHGPFNQTPHDHVQGHGCNKCGLQTIINKGSFTKEEFIKKAKEVHGDRYDYSKVEYVNTSTKVTIHCNTCDADFEQTPNSHLQGTNCPNCAGNRKLTTEEFIEKAEEIHGKGRYDYSKVDYVNSKTKVTIHCNVCDIDFEQLPSSHLFGSGCFRCAVASHAEKKKLTKEEFIEKAEEKHGKDKYDYSKIRYVNTHTKVTIHCNKCDLDFEQTPHGHLSGQGCPECNGTKKSTTKEFVEKANRIHGDRYDYSKVKYINNSTKVIIHCNNCGEDFEQVPSSHLSGRGCPRCNSSRGENLLRKLFSDNDIEFVEQKSWDWLVYREKQHVDFYIPDRNLVVEFQGQQHFISTEFFGGEEAFNETLLRDQNKKRLCEEHSIRVIYFSNMSEVIGEDFKYPYDVIEDIDELIRIINETPSIDVS